MCVCLYERERDRCLISDKTNLKKVYENEIKMKSILLHIKFNKGVFQKKTKNKGVHVWSSEEKNIDIKKFSL